MSQLWNVLLFQPFVNALILLYEFLFHNLGLAIIGLTLVIRALLIPLTLPSMRSASKMRELTPELEKLKKKFKGNPQELARAQMELYKKHGANPAAGCLPTIIQMIILIALYQAFYQVLRPDGDVIARVNQVLYPSLKLAEGMVINTKFFYLDLAKPDVFRIPGLSIPIPGIFLLTSAVTQFFASKIAMPVAKAAQKEASKTPEKADDVAASMQSQMLYLFPIMTILIGFSFPSGLILYWFIFSLFTLVQQYVVNQQQPVAKNG
jgi:YidC/Oxa1 family membrane protein insertase